MPTVPSTSARFAALFRCIRKVFAFETVFTLFLFAGQFKADPRLAWIPIDLTASLFVLSVILGVSLVWNDRGRSKSSMYLIWTYLAFIIWTAISLLWTPGWEYASTKTFYMGTLVFGSLVAGSIISSDAMRFDRFIFCLVLVGLVYGTSTLFFAQVGAAGVVQGLGATNRIECSRATSLAVVIVFYWLISHRAFSMRILIEITIVGIGLIALLRSGSRGPLLATLAAFVSVLIMQIYSRGNRAFILKFLLVVGILAVFLSVFMMKTDYEEDFATLKRLKLIHENPLEARSAGARIQNYAVSWELIANNIILGSGVGSWPVLCGYGDERQYPHNIFLEVWVEMGLVGVLLFLIMICLALINLFRSENPRRALCFMLLVLALLNTQVSGDIPDNRILFAFMGLSARLGALQESSVSPFST